MPVYGAPFNTQRQLIRWLRKGNGGLGSGLSEAAAKVKIGSATGGRKLGFGEGDPGDPGFPANVSVAIFDTVGTNQTWVNPGPDLLVEIYVIGPGGGGASGSKQGAFASGGGGGGGGGMSWASFNSTDLQSTVYVDVGAAGTGGAPQTAVTAFGVAGTAGGFCSVRGVGGSGITYADVSGGQGASLGNDTFSGGPGGGGMIRGGHGAGGARGTIPVVWAGAPTWNAGGGGSGIGFPSDSPGDGGPTARAGAGLWQVSGYKPGTRDGKDGSSSTYPGGFPGQPNSGGAGGGGSLTSNGGAGGDGGFPGGGGGGGGACTSSFNSGRGGNGAGGLVVIITYS